MEMKGKKCNSVSNKNTSNDRVPLLGADGVMPTYSRKKKNKIIFPF